jgi:hypothetical protein
MIILGQRRLPGSQICAIIPEFRELASPLLCFLGTRWPSKFDALALHRAPNSRGEKGGFSQHSGAFKVLHLILAVPARSGSRPVLEQ